MIDKISIPPHFPFPSSISHYPNAKIDFILVEGEGFGLEMSNETTCRYMWVQFE